MADPLLLVLVSGSLAILGTLVGAWYANGQAVAREKAAAVREDARMQAANERADRQADDERLRSWTLSRIRETRRGMDLHYSAMLARIAGDHGRADTIGHQLESVSDMDLSVVGDTEAIRSFLALLPASPSGIDGQLAVARSQARVRIALQAEERATLLDPRHEPTAYAPEILADLQATATVHEQAAKRQSTTTGPEPASASER